MACRVVAVALGALLALMLVEGLEAKSQAVHSPSTSASSHGSSFVLSSQSGPSFSRSSHSVSAQSEVIGPDGTLKGECAYLDPEGNYIKIKYTQPPGGQIQVESDPPLQNPAGALESCRTQAKAVADSAAKSAHETFLKTKQQIYQQQQALQDQIYRQNQAFRNMFSTPYFPVFPMHFPFNQNLP